MEVPPVLRSRNVVILVTCVLSLKSYRQKNTLTKTDHIVTNALKTNWSLKFEYDFCVPEKISF